MTVSSLDKWIEKEPEPSKYAHIFINVNELNYEFGGRDKVVNYKKLFKWLKKVYGIYFKPILYMGIYDKECVNSKVYKKQETQLNYLKSLGYHIKKCVKYHKKTGELIEKGSEVSIAIDLEHYGHPINDKYDKAVVLCNEMDRYRTIFKTIQTVFRKKIKGYSFAQEYENHYHDFMNFIQQVGDPKDAPSPPSNIWYEKPINCSNIIGMLNQNTLRSRLNSGSAGVNAKPQAFMFIDYGNIHHSLLDLKKSEKSIQTLTETALILKLRARAQKFNDLKGVIMYMGMPHKNISQLQKLRKKNEQMKIALEKHGIEVRFKYNENLYEGGMKEHGVDLSIGYTIIEKALENCFEKAILISGDADFVPVVTKLHELGKKVEIWAFTKPEYNCALSPFLIYELSKFGDISSSLKSINSLL